MLLPSPLLLLSSLPCCCSSPPFPDAAPLLPSLLLILSSLPCCCSSPLFPTAAPLLPSLLLLLSALPCCCSSPPFPAAAPLLPSLLLLLSSLPCCCSSPPFPTAAPLLPSLLLLLSFLPPSYSSPPFPAAVPILPSLLLFLSSLPCCYSSPPFPAANPLLPSLLLLLSALFCCCYSSPPFAAATPLLPSLLLLLYALPCSYSSSPFPAPTPECELCDAHGEGMGCADEQGRIDREMADIIVTDQANASALLSSAGALQLSGDARTDAEQKLHDKMTPHDTSQLVVRYRRKNTLPARDAQVELEGASSSDSEQSEEEAYDGKVGRGGSRGRRHGRKLKPLDQCKPATGRKDAGPSNRRETVRMKRAATNDPYAALVSTSGLGKRASRFQDRSVRENAGQQHDNTLNPAGGGDDPACGGGLGANEGEAGGVGDWFNDERKVGRSDPATPLPFASAGGNSQLNASGVPIIPSSTTPNDSMQQLFQA
ncbi:unnamed protein product [Closterium sp. Yama58-4]|nr:unnamed protein product [Closterium sp. Yama58-4]